MGHLEETCMLWALQAEEIEPIKSMELHRRLDQHLLSYEHVGGYLKGHPLMRYETSQTHSGITGTIV